ncbi:MAG: RluA family pseudouridine synthase [Dehalococcoidia bacterium]|nr:MAG: RluA family pseudouridine synthase [Dehalococcoidia bacterium]
MNKKLEFTVNSPGSRLDRYIAEHCQISRAYAQQLIGEGQITVNGNRSKASHRLAVGDRVVAIIPPPSPISLAPEDIPLKVVYEDSDLIVVDKPAGLLVHPAAGQRTGTLVNALLARCPDLQGIDGSVRPGIVHRLDKNTSGLMVVAKNDAAQMSLSRQIKQRSITKGYLALVAGRLSPERGAIEAPVGRHPKDRKRMAVVSGGREARTQYRVIKYLNGYTLLEAMPETGRTHQIRVHFSAIGHPVLGDPVYGKKSPLLGRQFLHAHRLGFRLPSTGEFVEFRAELPPDLEEVLAHLTTEATR